MLDTSVGKNIWYTSVGNIISSIFTYVFWFIAAKIAGAGVIGLTSAVASFVTIVVTIDVLNMSLGMKRSLGIAASSDDFGSYKQVIASTVIFVSIVVGVSMVVIAIPQLRVLESVGIDRQFTWIIIAMIPALAFQQVFSEALTAALRSKYLVMPLTIGALLRFPLLLVAILFFNTSNLAVIIAYSMVMFVSSILYAFYTVRIYHGNAARALQNAASNIRVVLKASLASWVPQIISVLGSQLGIITVFSLGGAAEGGKFYIPMAIFTVAFFIVSGINKVSHALVAGMSTKEEQKNYLLYSMNVAFIFTIPAATPLLFFAEDYLGLLGREFSGASSTLIVLMACLPLAIISEMIYYFLYGKGDHRAVLYLGLVGNVPRTILYFVLVPIMGAYGAALAYLAGTVAQFVLSIGIAKKHSVTIPFKRYAVLTAVPVAIGAATWAIQLHFVLSTVLILVATAMSYVKLHLFTEAELKSILYATLPQKTAEKVSPALLRLMQKIS